MNVLSLFDGISCGRIALDRAGVEYENYFASEIDKFAIATAQKNYPDTIQIGDVRNVKSSDLPHIDLILAGSPCQGFSYAGKQLNFNDPRSKLFFEFVRLLNECQPEYYLLENVKMKKCFELEINRILGKKPHMINSRFFSAQNRLRYYWTNIKFNPIINDLGIVLQDILENGYTDRLKNFCVMANEGRGGNLKRYYAKGGRTLIFQRKRGFNQGGIISSDGKAPALTSHSWEHNNFLVVAGRDETLKGFDQNKRIYKKTGKAPTLTCAKGGAQYPKVEIEEALYRKLTPVECERLQTLPDNYTAGVSNTQRYKQIGNGWTVDVVTHILKGLKVKSCKSISTVNV